MTAGFATLQRAENALIPALIDAAGVDWILELAPAASPSPALNVPRHRVLISDDQWIWPFQAETGELPLADESVPALLMRHVFWQADSADVFEDALRCLRPGGLLVSVSANPWHRGSWNELGWRALRLPAWPQFVVQHARHSLMLQVPSREHWRSVVPGLSPVLLIAARKPPRAAAIRRLEPRRRFAASAGTAPSTCRAA